MKFLSKHIFVLTAAIILTFGQPSFAQENRFSAILNDFLGSEGLSGGTILVSGPETDMIISAGIADKQTQAPVSSQTLFYIASTGKMLVATAILAFVEDGTLALDTPVWPQIKDIKGIERLENADSVTLRQLLNHTSGLAEYLDDEFFDASSQNPTKNWSSAEAVSYAFDYAAPADPGTIFEYCNTNYVLLGHILENISGSLSNALTQKIFTKANIKTSSVGGPSGVSLLAHGYDAETGADTSQQAWASTLGDGPLVTNVTDMKKFAHALLRDKTLLGEQTLQQMLTGSAHEMTYGLGIGIDEDDWGPSFGHAGSYDGFEADLRYYPLDDVLFIFVTNGNQTSDETIIDALADTYFTR